MHIHRSSSPAPTGSSAATSSLPSSTPATTSVALVRDEEAGDTVARRLTAGPARAPRPCTIGDVTRPETLPAALAGVGRGRSTSPRFRATGTAARASASSTPRGRGSSLRAATEAGVRRFVHLGAMGVVDDPDLHYASTKAKAIDLVRRRAASTGRSSSPSVMYGPRDGFFNILAEPRPAVAGRHADHRQRRRAVPAARGRGPRPGAVQVFADDATIGRELLLGGPRYWTYREIVEEVLRGMGKRRALVPMPVPLIRLVAGVRRGRPAPVLPGRDRPAPPAQARQHRPARRRPRGARVRDPQPMEGSLDPPPPPVREQEPGRRVARLPTRGYAPRRGGGRSAILAAIAWLAVAVLIALGGAGIVAAMNHVPATAARPELTWAADEAATREARRGDRPPRDAHRIGRRRWARIGAAGAGRGRRGRRRPGQRDRRRGHAPAGRDRAGGRRPRGVARRDPGRRQRQRAAPLARGPGPLRRPRPDPGFDRRARGRLAAFTGPALDAANLNALLARHDQETAAAAQQGVQEQYPQALLLLDDRGRDDPPDRAPSATGSRRRPTSSTLTRWIERNAAVRRRAAAPVRRADRRQRPGHRRGPRGVRRRAEGPAPLPLDTRPLVVIMSDVAAGRASTRP